MKYEGASKEHGRLILELIPGLRGAASAVKSSCAHIGSPNIYKLLPKPSRYTQFGRCVSEADDTA